MLGYNIWHPLQTIKKCVKCDREWINRNIEMIEDFEISIDDCSTRYSRDTFVCEIYCEKTWKHEAIAICNCDINARDAN